jgi:Uma2 family endonuclease
MAIDPSFSEELAPKQPKHSGAMSEEEFHELEDRCPDYRYEYVAGRAHKMGGATVGHSRISRNIVAILQQYLSGSCDSFGTQVQVLLTTPENGQKHYVFTDATVSCNPEDSCRHNTLIKSPRVVFEVIGPDTEARDRRVKFHIYQKCPTIHEIVLVNQYAPYLEIWQRDRQNVETWHHRYYMAGDTVEFASINVHVDIEELYLGLQFPVDEDEE